MARKNLTRQGQNNPRKEKGGQYRTRGPSRRTREGGLIGRKKKKEKALRLVEPIYQTN